MKSCLKNEVLYMYNKAVLQVDQSAKPVSCQAYFCEWAQRYQLEAKTGMCASLKLRDLIKVKIKSPALRVRFKLMGNHEYRSRTPFALSLVDAAVERALKRPNDQAQGERCQIGETSLQSKNEIHITPQFESHPSPHVAGGIWVPSKYFE
jgi:hypothetical protein